MNIAELIIHRVEGMPEDHLVKLLEYIEFLEYQEEKKNDGVPKAVRERSEAFDKGKVQAISKKEFWENLQRKIS